MHNGVITPLTPYGLDTQFTLLPEELKRFTWSLDMILR